MSSRQLFFLGLLLILYSCNENERSPYKIFKYNLSSGLNTLDPAFAKELSSMWACSHIYEGLFYLDKSTELKPLLVDSFWMEKDNKSYHFILKKNVFFHRNKCFAYPDSTRRLIAQDIVYSLSRLVSSQTASPGAWVLQNKLDSSSPFEIIDSFHLMIKLKQPNAQFLQILSMPYCSVVPKEAVDYYQKDFRKNPVGTGAFQFKLWDEGNALFLKKNPNYYFSDTQGKRLPYLDYIRINFNENKKSELLSFQRNELSFITSLDAASIQEIFDEKGTLKTPWNTISQALVLPYLSTEYLAINLKKTTSPLLSIYLRKAINYAIDRRELASQLKRSLVTPANKGFVAMGMPHYDTSFWGYEYNPVLAKKLILEAGYSDKNKPAIELYINNQNIELAEWLSYQLSQVGIKAEIKLQPADRLMQMATEGQIDFFRRSWIADYPDAENFLACFYSKNSCPPNYTRFTNANYDKLYEATTIEPNSTKRKQYYLAMEKIIVEQSPVVPLYYEKSIRIVQKNIVGLEQNAVNTLDLRRVDITPPSLHRSQGLR